MKEYCEECGEAIEGGQPTLRVRRMMDGRAFDIVIHSNCDEADLGAGFDGDDEPVGSPTRLGR